MFTIIFDHFVFSLFTLFSLLSALFFLFFVKIEPQKHLIRFNATILVFSIIAVAPASYFAPHFDYLIIPFIFTSSIALILIGIILRTYDFNKRAILITVSFSPYAASVLLLYLYEFIVGPTL